jgi:hypothetical protein
MNPQVTHQATGFEAVQANLVDNATRAAGPSGTVTIEVGRQQNSALLAVEDTGPGFGKIPAGLGLGLAAVSRNALRHGGRVECGCGASGGTRVNLWLPVSAGQMQAGGTGSGLRDTWSTTSAISPTDSSVGRPTWDKSLQSAAAPIGDPWSLGACISPIDKMLSMRLCVPRISSAALTSRVASRPSGREDRRSCACGLSSS